MKRGKITLLGILTLFVLVVGCGEDKKDAKQDIQSKVVNEAPETDKDFLYLNEGNKWIANSTTVDGIHDMASLHGQFVISNSPADADVLVGELNAILDGIFNACDMEGEAHNQLHIFLVPLIQSIDELGAAETTEIAMAKHDEVLKNLLVFDEFFEGIK